MDPQSPLGSFPELAKAYASSLAQGGRRASAAGDQYNTGVQVANDKEAIQSQIERLSSLSDPKSYKKVRKEDGGFDFFDPEGQQVDIATITQRTGSRAIDWIDDSENPIDVQYKNDYSNLQDFMNAVLSKDQEKVDAYKARDPNLNQYVNGRGGIDQLMKDFKSVYERYYTPRSVKPQAWGTTPNRTVVSAPQSGGSDTEAFLNQLRQAAQR